MFRTTFDLTGRLPSKAVLKGKFLADDRLVGIRLNGHRLPVPLHRDGTPFLDWTSFQTSAGFATDRNVLEFDVLNSSPYQSPSQRRTLKSMMGFRAELQGTAASDPEFGDNRVSDNRVSGNRVGGTRPRGAAEKSVRRPNRRKLASEGFESIISHRSGVFFLFCIPWITT